MNKQNACRDWKINYLFIFTSLHGAMKAREKNWWRYKQWFILFNLHNIQLKRIQIHRIQDVRCSVNICLLNPTLHMYVQENLRRNGIWLDLIFTSQREVNSTLLRYDDELRKILWGTFISNVKCVNKNLIDQKIFGNVFIIHWTFVRNLIAGRK